MKSLRQIKDLASNLSKKTKINSSILLRIYFMERFLERLSLSKHKNKFILKGGLLIQNLIDISNRSTIDIDTTLKASPLKEDVLKIIISEILEIDLNDNVFFTITGVVKIHEDSKYEGLRFIIEASLEKAKIPIKIDITTGDIITPKEISYLYKTIINNNKINLLAYNLETIFAEKIETIISRSVANTRMKDFYDIYILFKKYENVLDFNILKSAMQSTFKQRNSLHLLKHKNKIINEVFSSKSIEQRYNLYSKNNEFLKNYKISEIEEVIIKIFDLLKV